MFNSKVLLKKVIASIKINKVKSNFKAILVIKVDCLNFSFIFPMKKI